MRISLKKLGSNTFLHSIKTAIACILGIIICAAFNIHNSLWIVITILVVMCEQTHFGGAIKASAARAIGTLMGAVIAYFSLRLLPANSVDYLLIIFIAVFWFSYIANSKSALRDAGLLGAMTTVTILMNTQATTDLALLRVLEILAGILIALLVSKLVFPFHARVSLLHSIADNLRDYIKLYNVMYKEIPMSEKFLVIQKLEEDIVNNLSAQRSLISEAKREITHLPFNKAIAESILGYQYRLYRSIMFLHQSLNKVPENFPVLIHLKSLCKLNQEIVSIVKQLADSIEDIGLLPSLDNLNETLQHAIKSVEKNANGADTKALIQIDTILFCSQQIVDEISVLQMLIGSYKQT